MNRHLTVLLAGALAFLGACSSGGGCDGNDNSGKQSSGESTSLPGGASSHGGPGETVSFQGLGRKTGGESGSQTAAASAALGGNGGAAPPSAVTPDAAQSVICGGFPNLAADCKTDPAYDAVVKKCCPTGQVDTCQAIPGGARLVGHRCTAAPGGPVEAGTK